MITCLCEKFENKNLIIADDILLSKQINLKEEIVDLSVKH